MLKLLILVVFLSYASTVFAQNNSNSARDFLELFFKQDFDKAHNLFGDDLKSKAPVTALSTIRQQIIGSFGNFVKIIEAKEASATQVFITCEFEKSVVVFSTVFNSENKIAGFTVADSKPKNAPKYEPPSYANPASFEETEVTVGSGEWALPGTLTLPKGAKSVPAIVLVHGSGPNDRDETHINPANKIFKDVAWGLASKGIAVLRYDKRTRVHGRKMTSKITINEETVNDAVLAVELLRKTPNIDPKKIYLLGHSLGGYMIPRIGLNNKKIAGFVVFAGTARPLEDVIMEQNNYFASLDDKITSQEQLALDDAKKQVEAIKNLQSNSLSGKTYFGLYDYYWFDLKNYNPTQISKNLRQPMLILQGESDFQVTMMDFAVWKKGLGKRKNVIFKSYPNLSHSFMDIAGGKPSMKDYEAASHVKEILIADIANWILKGAKK